MLPPVAATSQIAVVDAPASIVAEAYRRLRVGDVRSGTSAGRREPASQPTRTTAATGSGP